MRSTTGADVSPGNSHALVDSLVQQRRALLQSGNFEDEAHRLNAMIAQQRSFAGSGPINVKELEAEFKIFRGKGDTSVILDARFPAPPAGENFLRALVTFCRELLERKGKTAEYLPKEEEPQPKPKAQHLSPEDA